MAIDRENVRRPSVPREAVQCDALGGEVIVQGMLLTERLRMSQLRTALAKPQPGETAEAAAARAGAELVPKVLASTILASDGKPLFTEAEWQAFGATESGAALELFHASMRLSGHDLADARKNS